MTLMVAAFHLFVSVLRAWYCACSLISIAYWDKWNESIVNLISHTCAFPANKSECRSINSHQGTGAGMIFGRVRDTASAQPRGQNKMMALLVSAD